MQYNADWSRRLETDINRIHVLGEWRVIYIAKLREAAYVLRCFQKKTQKSNAQDIELVRQRYKLLWAEYERRNPSYQLVW